MIRSVGDYEFAVDFDIDFIQYLNCYADGKYCPNCPEYEECCEELDYAMQRLKEKENHDEYVTTDDAATANTTAD